MHYITVGPSCFAHNSSAWDISIRERHSFPVTFRHKKLIDVIYRQFKQKYPKAIASYSPKINSFDSSIPYGKRIHEDSDWPEENNWFCRLEWLKYWVDWALNNCEKPVIYNS